MSQTPHKTPWAAVLVLGSLWGLSEAALGMSLRQCASTVSGSVMTGAAFFFLAAAWALSPGERWPVKFSTRMTENRIKRRGPDITQLQAAEPHGDVWRDDLAHLL